MPTRDKTYQFDDKLKSDDIKYIGREEFNRLLANIRCERCNATLKRYVVHLRIDKEIYNIGADCYSSIKAILSEIRGKSHRFIVIDLEEKYDNYLKEKLSEEELPTKPGKSTYKWDPDYERLKAVQWDIKHENPPVHIKKEYEDLKKKIGEMERSEEAELGVKKKVSKEWHDARLVVLDDFWTNKIDFETFKVEIERVDKLFRVKKDVEPEHKASQLEISYRDFENHKKT